ncbi:hypothetical protein NDU88_003497 [Pleurodeles waltl]|uniref:Uncharacterized protein n=1 Tax=Pleurodeles waltl TaxID=8319 RepID=A0AAV7T4Z9_PLEWA|nr:hypothetical protein NDU88_003497 [Pleurodeles waltl]
MGTPPDASVPDFRVSQTKERTDWRDEKGEFPPKRRKTEPRETPRAEKEANGPETISEPRGEDPKRSQDPEVCTSRHDPGGLWLTKTA